MISDEHFATFGKNSHFPVHVHVYRTEQVHHLHTLLSSADKSTYT